jgi:hypothetical protein
MRWKGKRAKKGKMLFIVFVLCCEQRQEDVTDFYKGHLHFYEKRHSIMRKLDVGPTIDAASWRSVDGGVYARGPKGYVVVVGWSWCIL